MPETYLHRIGRTARAKAAGVAISLCASFAMEMILAKAGPGIRFNEHMEGDGETVFRHACKLGLEGIVSKRKGSPYRSGRSPDWLKMKSSDAPAVKREEEEECGKKKWR